MDIIIVGVFEVDRGQYRFLMGRFGKPEKNDNLCLLMIISFSENFTVDNLICLG